MGTISKSIADDVIAGKYEDDRPVKIVKYTDAWPEFPKIARNTGRKSA